jgi:hypothetical protein
VTSWPLPLLMINFLFRSAIRIFLSLACSVLALAPFSRRFFSCFNLLYWCCCHFGSIPTAAVCGCDDSVWRGSPATWRRPGAPISVEQWTAGEGGG